MLFRLELDKSKYYDKASTTQYKKLGFEFTLIAKKFYIVNQCSRVVEFESLEKLTEFLSGGSSRVVVLGDSQKLRLAEF